MPRRERARRLKLSIFMSDNILVALLSALVYFSCIAYAGVPVLPLTIIEIAAVLILAYRMAQTAYKAKVSVLKVSVMVPLCLFLGIVIFQLLPLPDVIFGFLAGHSADLYRDFISAAVKPSFLPLSICPYSTLSELFKFIAYAAVFFVALDTLRSRRQFNYFFNMIIILGVLISIMAIVQKYTYQGRVFWFDRPDSAPAAFGPFANRNNFCGYVNMIVPLSLGYILYSRSRVKKILYAVSIWIMVLAIFFSSSRAGILICILTNSFMLVVSAFRRGIESKGKAMVVYLALIFFASFFYVDFKHILKRFLTLFDSQTLVAFGHGYSWSDILRIWKDFPVFGTGLGTFGNISSMYKTTPFQVSFIYAHNDYLQLLSETGVVGFGTAMLFFIFYLRFFIKGWQSRHNDYAVWLGLAGLASVVGMLAYSLLDFNLHIPGNAVLFFAIMGVSCRLILIRFDEHGAF